MDNKSKSSWLKGAVKWTVLCAVSVIFGSFLTHVWYTCINPLWSTVISTVTGKKCCFKAPDAIPLEVFAKQMTKLNKMGYIISFSPEAAKEKIAPGTYDCQETYFDVVKHVLSRNSGNLRYETDPNKKSIHITVSQKEKKPKGPQ